MKQATQYLSKHYPFVEKMLGKQDIPQLYNEQERTFIYLARFFEEPHDQPFQLSLLFQHLQDESLNIALNAIQLFFYRDTYLINDQDILWIKEKDEYLNQSRFVDYLNEHGLNFSRAKLNMYIKRGTVPKPDLMLSGTKFWHVETCHMFLKKQLNKGEDNGIYT